MTLELLVWKDAQSVDEWCDLKDLCMDAKKVLSIGLVVKETDETVAIAVGFCAGDMDMCCTLLIPKGMILKREVLADEKQVGEWLA